MFILAVKNSMKLGYCTAKDIKVLHPLFMNLACLFRVTGRQPDINAVIYQTTLGLG
jgi:hypothetical protein